MNYTTEQIDKFLKENLEICIGLCREWKLEILDINDLRQASEYLLDQI